MSVFALRLVPVLGLLITITGVNPSHGDWYFSENISPVVTNDFQPLPVLDDQDHIVAKLFGFQDCTAPSLSANTAFALPMSIDEFAQFARSQHYDVDMAKMQVALQDSRSNGRTSLIAPNYSPLDGLPFMAATEPSHLASKQSLRTSNMPMLGVRRVESFSDVIGVSYKTVAPQKGEKFTKVAGQPFLMASSHSISTRTRDVAASPNQGGAITRWLSSVSFEKWLVIWIVFVSIIGIRRLREPGRFSDQS